MIIFDNDTDVRQLHEAIEEVIYDSDINFELDRVEISKEIYRKMVQTCRPAGFHWNYHTKPYKINDESIKTPYLIFNSSKGKIPVYILDNLKDNVVKFLNKENQSYYDLISEHYLLG